MDWKTKKNGYVCSCGSSSISLTLTWSDDAMQNQTWCVRFMTDGQLECKKIFWLKDEEGVEDAKRKAIEVIEEYLMEQKDHYEQLQNQLAEAKVRTDTQLSDAVKALIDEFHAVNKRYQFEYDRITQFIKQKIDNQASRDLGYLRDLRHHLVSICPHEAYNYVAGLITRAEKMDPNDLIYKHPFILKQTKEVLTVLIDEYLSYRNKLWKVEKDLSDHLNAYMDANGVWEDKDKLMTLISITPPIQLRFAMWEQKFELDEKEGNK